MISAQNARKILDQRRDLIIHVGGTKKLGSPAILGQNNLSKLNLHTSNVS